MAFPSGSSMLHVWLVFAALALLAGGGAGAVVELGPNGQRPARAGPAYTLSYQGYNITGFENTTGYYNLKSIAPPDAGRVPAPNVPAAAVPENCTVLSRFAIANWTGPLPCKQPAGAVPDIVAGGNESLSDQACIDLRGKVVVITGASTGIGFAAANRLAAAGARIVGTSRSPWRYPRPAHWDLAQMDQTSSESVKQFISYMANAYGRIDVLHLNAGQWWIGDMANSDLRQMQMVFETDFWGPVRVLQAALPLMPRSGYARVLLTSSVQSQVVFPNSLPYTAAKRALLALQEEWYSTHANRSTNIDFLALLPGTVNTSLGYHTVAGCPELAAGNLGSRVRGFRVGALDPRAAGPAVYRLLIAPRPPLVSLLFYDDEWPVWLPLMCRRSRLTVDQIYVKQSANFGDLHQADCRAHCGGRDYCGSGPIGGEAAGYGSIVGYPSSVFDTFA